MHERVIENPKKYFICGFIFFLYFIMAFFLTCCDGGNEAADEEHVVSITRGAFVLDISWPENTPMSIDGIDCSKSKVTKILAQIYDTNGRIPLVSKEFKCSDHGGLLNSIRAGHNRWVKITSMDDDGNVYHEGKESGITIRPGTITKSKGILMAVVSENSQENFNGKIWKSSFGGALADKANSVQETADGGYIVTGYTSSFGNGEDDIWLIKTDAEGEEEWNKTYGGLLNERAFSVQQTSDGGYIIVGYIFSNYAVEGDIWLIKTDADGDARWNKIFGGDAFDYAMSVKETTDGGYIIAGTTFSDGAARDAWLIRTDSDGEEEWNKTFGGSSLDYAYSAQETADGGFIFAGSTIVSSSTGDREAWLVKTNSKGNMQWEKTFGGTYGDEAYSVQQTSDGGYILAGSTESYAVSPTAYSDAWLIKTDPDGNKEWIKIFGGDSSDEARSVQETEGGGYIIAGFTHSYGAGSHDAWLIKTDMDGEMEWSKTFGDIYSEKAFSAQQTRDGGYIIAGHNSDENDNVWLIKTDNRGRSAP